MIKVGDPPYLECSSRGDKRFSAFYARPKFLKGRSIEEAYQDMKVFNDGKTNLGWREAKGRRASNQEECERFYRYAWEEYIIEKDLLHVLKAATGLSDVFGQKNHICQALVLWDIRNKLDI